MPEPSTSEQALRQRAALSLREYRDERPARPDRTQEAQLSRALRLQVRRILQRAAIRA